MRSHDLANELLALPNLLIETSVDLSTSDADSDHRAFSDIIEVQSDSRGIMLLCIGTLNFKFKEKILCQE